MSLLVSPSTLARNALVTRLLGDNVVTGFNPVYTTALPFHSGAPPMTIDFVGPKSKNFFLGDVDPESIEETGTFTYPLLTVFSMAGGSTNTQKFQRFAGPIKIGARFFLSGLIYKNSGLMQDFEAWPDAVEDTFLQVVQEPVAQNWPNTAASSVLYNGEVVYERKFPVQGGTNWLQVLTFKMTFEVVIA